MRTSTSPAYVTNGTANRAMSAFFHTNIVIDLLAGHPPALAESARHSEVGISRITWMEVLIGAPDAATQTQWESFLRQFQLVEMDEDILPGGHPVAAHLQWARTVCRRAERWVVSLADHEKIPSELIVYLNRLSDYLFVLARWFNLQKKISETPWKKK